MFCLSIYKRSPSCYNFLHNHLPCPAISTLKSELNNIPLKAGCTRMIIKFLKYICKNIKDESAKYVVLLWDEMSLQPSLIYNKMEDQIIGFEDWGMRRTRKIADHAITFYFRCLKTGQKMPLGYGFCESATKASQLVCCIKQWLANIIISGFIPVATVCDQGATNIAAINTLIADSNLIRAKKNLPPKNTFIIKGKEIVPIYDYVHLLKATRNNLLTKDLDINKNTCQEIKYASWEDIKIAFDMDKNTSLKYRQLRKITDKHIHPNVIPKMRVKYASQVFSATLANFLDIILLLSIDKTV
ncbi:uncharacterized protein LOC105203458 [Solenopsis invicta]|uniref:uncharacterized protein LOC105203458 n=1 Tax=Solenopsis invicta TaxID=13686 RepID=UPI00193CA9BF|nr:uncharacterized protein LOC105203458 [Solenopsis invicta]